MKYLIKPQKIFDGEEIKEGYEVLIEGEKIVGIYKKGGIKEGIKKEIKEEISCQFLMPGLIDMHVHIAGYEEKAPSGYPFKIPIRFLKLLLLNGITTVRDLGNYLECIHYLKKWIKKYDGPFVYSSGPILDSPPLQWPFSRVIQSKEDAIKEIKRLKIEEVDWIKVYVNIDDELLKIIAEECLRNDLKVALHFGKASVDTVLNLNIHTIKHVTTLIQNQNTTAPLSDDKEKNKIINMWYNTDVDSFYIEKLIEKLVNSHIYLCPTLVVLQKQFNFNEMINERYIEYIIPIMPYHRYFEGFKNPIARAFATKYMKKYAPSFAVSKEEEKIYKVVWEKILKFTQRLINNGVKIIVGTDTPNPSVVPGFSLYQEMKLLEELNMKTLDILKSATSEAAKILKDDNIGRIKEGKIANLLIINEPEIIKEGVDKILDKLEYIIIKGNILKREELLEKYKEYIKEASDER